MVKRKRVVVKGYGNVGKAAVKSIKQAPDMELAGVLRRKESLKDKQPAALRNIPVKDSIGKFDDIGAVLLCVPSRKVPSLAPDYLDKGVNTVDGFDIHGQKMVNLYTNLQKKARKNGSVAVIGAGWDPGADSMVRGLFEAMAPSGVTYVNFGPGMSLGHTVAVKAFDGVKDALSLTIPKGYGEQRRDVYVELEEGVEFSYIEKKIKNDPYFTEDQTTVKLVEDVSKLIDMGHGVKIDRWGCSGGNFHDQRFQFNIRVNNPALTAQMMTVSARASFSQEPGAYTLPEIPIIDLLERDSKSLVEDMV